ncbi:MAG: ASKHA domain-containing protein [Bacteroidales bacterium]|nr:ASKHA domain-containing protein [Bacteroidales bacterium]
METVRITLLPPGKELTVTRGASLIDALHEFGVEFPCGGKGRCGKCKVKVAGGLIQTIPEHQRKLKELGLSPEWRLACMSRAEEDLVLEVGQFETMIQADESSFSFVPLSGYGVAVDLGTTTLVAQLVDLSSSKVLAVETALNPQRRWGSDLITRLESALAGNGPRLSRLIREEIGAMLLKLTGGRKTRIERIVMVGNTVMQHLFSGADIRPLAYYPFDSPDLGIREFSASGLDWDLNCDRISFFPSIGSFVGSDILAGIHATDLWRRKEYSVLVDLGTNGEIVVGNRERLLCASTAAGPAFEGARISRGMLATTGAISSVTDSGEGLSCRVIGNVPASGICGSGLIDAVATLLDRGMLGVFGEILSGDGEIALTEGVSLTARDIQEFLLAKAAIAAGLTILLRKLGISAEEISRIYISGAFGTYINLEKMLRTGMMDFPPDRFRKLGNSALMGAKMFLFSPMELTEKILGLSSHVNLESEKDFQDIYVNSLSFNTPSS